MSEKDETTASIAEAPPSLRGDLVMALVLVWSNNEPDRTGEVALFPPETKDAVVLGRGDNPEQKEEKRVRFHRQRPGSIEARPSLEGAALSRRQLEIRFRAGGLQVERVGRCAMRVNGVELDRTLLAPGDVLHVVGQLVLYCTQRPRGALPACEFWKADVPFGEPDAFGIVGESEVTWALRERLGFAAALDGHLLLLGDSGTGKELAARAVHSLSARKTKRFVARNAATLPSGLVDAELFGNVKNYPNPGMPERPGLVGEADGGTLFLDEVGELPHELQAHLLRMLDRGGEYQRLGEAKTLRANVRVIGATNRPLDALKHDLLARFSVRLDVPLLVSRREDIALLARHVLERIRVENPALEGRIKGKGLSDALVDDLVRREYPGNIRDLETALLTALAPRAMQSSSARVAVPASPAQELSEADVKAALAKHGYGGRDASRALGLASRYDLLKLMKKYGIPIPSE